MNKPLLVLYLLILCSLAGYGQNCTLNVNITSSAPNICSGNKVTLTTNLTGGTGPYTYLWNTGETTASIDVNRAGTFTVTVTDKTPGCQPVVANKSVTAVNTPNPPTVQGQRVCPGSSATLTATAPGGTYQWYDADGNFLFTGNPYVTGPITQGTIFYVETTVGGCTSFRSTAVVNVTGKPSVQSDPVCSGGPVTLIASGADSYAWYANASGTGTPLSTSSTYQTPSLTKTTPYYLVVVIGDCKSDPILINARVIPPPSKPTITAINSVCAGSSVNLHADGDGIIEWYDVPSGGTPLISSPDYTTPVLNATKTYYAQANVGDCVSPRAAIQVQVTSLPQAPASQSPSTCYGTSTTLIADANPTGSYAWFTTAVGGTAVSNSNSFVTPVLTSTTTYYVQHSNGDCTSDRTPVTVNITSQPSPPDAADVPPVCNGGQATLAATSTQTGGAIQWFTAASGGNPVFTGSPFVTPALTKAATYYVQYRDAGGCASERIPVSVTVLDAITKPVVTTTPICAGTAATLKATGSLDDYQWYDQPTGGTMLIAGDTYVTPELTTTTTYYVQSIVNDCISPRTAVTVTVNPIPVAPNVNGPTQVCPGESVVLNSPASGTVQWFNVATGGTPIFTGTSYTTPPLFNQTTFYVQVSNGSCESDRTPFTVSITSVLNPQFQYPSGTVCTSGANVRPVIFNPAGGTFSSLPGLVFVNNSTGEINVAASIPNNYTVIFTYGGTCAGASSQKIAIVTTPDARFTYNGPFCQSENNPLPVFNAGASAGVFSSSSPKLVFKNTSTGEIDLDKSSAGTFQVTNTIAASAGCAASTYTTQVKINARVFVDAGPPQTILQGTTAQLAGSISGGVTTGKWTGGTGSFSDPTDLKAIYTPAAGETQVTLTLTSDRPVSPCGPISRQVTITISPVPPEPTVDAKPVCAGSSATLIATAPGGTYRWYDAATGGNLLKTGAIFTTPPITADITYYVSVTKGGITSPRKAVLVTANLQPAPPDITVPAQVCQGSAVTLVATGSTGIYKWYDLPVGGNLLKQGDTFTSGVLTISRTYYVETTVNGCTSDRKKVDVPVTPIAHVIGVGPNPVCSGTALNYTITADRTDATFSWSRAAVTGISNAAVTSQTTNTITETLINTTGNAINVDYVITPLNGACAGPSVTYTVIVNPTPAITNQTPPPVCNGNSTDYTPIFTTTGTSYNWSRAAVDGISNAAVSGQAAATIKEVLFNTTTAPIDVIYVFNYKTASCQAEPYPLIVRVNPEPQVTGDASNPNPVCSNTPLGYVIKSNIPSATFIWSRPTVAGITNPAVDNQTDAVINEALVNTAPFGVRVTYTITPFAYGCAGKPFTYSVTIAPQIVQPDARSNSPVCEGQDIRLQTPAVAGATFLWTGPNNFQSESQNPVIPKATIANQGEYKLYFKVGNCLSEPSPIQVVVNPTPVVSAGSDEKYCKTIQFIQLNGSIPTSGTGVWTSSDPNGRFAEVDNPQTTYTPSIADRENGSVKLTLTSTGYCDPVKSTITITFGPSQGAEAGPASIDGVCNQNPMVTLSGASVLPGTTPHWTSASGKGTFIPSADVISPTFQPDPSDVANGFVKLTLTAVGVDECYTGTDNITINFVPPPTVQADAAGDTRYVLKDHTITLNPVVSDENVTYLWTPATGLSDNTVKNPQVTGDADISYKLTITKTSNGCPNFSFVNVKVSPNISVKNTFTPNGDGANDYWEITGLVAYEDVTVDVFNRYGKQVFHSLGYPKPWDGTTNGGAVPSGTYYYVINSKQENLRLSGYVVILK